jgi:hypothetical protein
MRPLPVGLATVLFGAIALGGCGDGDGVGPGAACEFSGITALDASGILVGTEDPDDWCAEVIAFPNPMAALTSIRFTLAQDQQVRIAVRDAVAGEIRVLVDQMLPAGLHMVDWDGTSDSGARVDDGIYCVTVRCDAFSCTGDIEVR